jgi:hypothetical protein
VSGRIHGEVLDLARQLKAQGLSRNAIDALTVLAEAVRDETRIGSCSRARIAAKLWEPSRAPAPVEKTASRAVKELTKSGLVRVVMAGGGHGRTAVVACYEVVDLNRWLADRRDITDRRDIQVSPGSEEPRESAGHADVPPNVPPIEHEPNRRDIGGQSAGHLGVPPPVLPVKESSGPVLHGTTRPRAAVEPPTAPPPTAPSTRASREQPRCPRHDDQPTGSWGPDCHDCAVLGRAHRARQTEHARAYARARRACTECNAYGLMLGAGGELLDLRCAHPTVPDEIWSGHALTAPPNPPPVEAGHDARHRMPTPAATSDDHPPPRWRPSPHPRTRPLERTPA